MNNEIESQSHQANLLEISFTVKRNNIAPGTVSHTTAQLATARENSDVSPAASVVVAVTNRPLGNVRSVVAMNVTSPAALVVSLTKKNVCTWPCAGLALR